MIKAKVIADSVSTDNVRITTFELEYPRFIHSEFMTHRVFSRNAASSRAIPTKKLINLVKTELAEPISYGINKPGMSASEDLSGIKLWMAETTWKVASLSAVFFAKVISGLGVHKQVVNRILEPFQNIKVVVTATDWDNFYNLRMHKDAQPEIKYLAEVMDTARTFSAPKILNEGEWHLPYIITLRIEGELTYNTEVDGKLIKLTLEEAKKISASCCAQISYRLLDNSIEKALFIYDKLVNSRPIHASPFEHQATPFDGSKYYANFRGWKQLRKEIENDSTA